VAKYLKLLEIFNPSGIMIKEGSLARGVCQDKAGNKACCECKTENCRLKMCLVSPDREYLYEQLKQAIESEGKK
jgi:hypothetical protein